MTVIGFDKDPLGHGKAEPEAGTAQGEKDGGPSADEDDGGPRDDAQIGQSPTETAASGEK